MGGGGGGGAGASSSLRSTNPRPFVPQTLSCSVYVKEPVLDVSSC